MAQASLSPKSVSFVPEWVPPVIGLGLSPCRLGDPLAAGANVSHAELQAAQGWDLEAAEGPHML